MCEECDKIENRMDGADSSSLDALYGPPLICSTCNQHWYAIMKQGNHKNPPKEGYWYCYIGYYKK